MAGRLANVRILVADPSRDAQEILGTLLFEWGADVRVAAAAGEALREFIEWRPDLLTTELEMVDDLESGTGGGISLIRAVRGLTAEDGGGTPILALTARARDFDRLNALGAGANHYLPKPVTPDQLVEAVEALVAEPPAVAIPPREPTD